MEGCSFLMQPARVQQCCCWNSIASFPFFGMMPSCMPVLHEAACFCALQLKFLVAGVLLIVCLVRTGSVLYELRRGHLTSSQAGSDLVPGQVLNCRSQLLLKPPVELPTPPVSHRQLTVNTGCAVTYMNRMVLTDDFCLHGCQPWLTAASYNSSLLLLDLYLLRRHRSQLSSVIENKRFENTIASA